jgi:hypothetical protein
VAQQTVEIYDLAQQEFVPFAADIIDWDTLLGSQQWPPKNGMRPVVVTANLYDIPRTMIAALRNLNKHYPSAYSMVYNYPRNLREVAEAQTGINMVVVTTFPPIEIANKRAWQEMTVHQSLGAGCVGALVDFDPSELAAEHTNKAFFRYD